MKRDSVGCQFNFEIDPVVAVNIEGDVHYRNLKSAIKEGRPSCMVCFPQLLGFRSEEGARNSCVVYRVEERAARVLCEKISGPEGGVAKPYGLKGLGGHSLKPPSLRPGNDM
jgi:hypothetical protein